MKPGDLVTIREWNITYNYPITDINVYHVGDSRAPYPCDEDGGWKWKHGEVGVLLGGYEADLGMVQVLHGGRVGWVDEEYLGSANETR